MIYVFYSNDPLHEDQGGGAEHFRGIYRALGRSKLDYLLVASKLSPYGGGDENIVYVSHGTHFLRYFFALWVWFFRNRKTFGPDDVFHFHRNYAAWPKYVFARRRGRTVLTYHGLTGNVIKGWLGPLAVPVRVLMRWLEARSLVLADEIIFVSQRDRDHMADSLLRGQLSKTKVIPAAFNSSRFIGSKPAHPRLAKKVLMVGRIAEIKNIPLAIDAVCLLGKSGLRLELTIAGDGDQRNAVEDYARMRGCLGQIRFVGRVPHHEVPSLMADHGVVLLTSHSEASPTVVKEAIASSRPVVATDVGDVHSWIQEGANGFISGHSPDQVSDALRKAVEMVERGSYIQTEILTSFSEEMIMSKVLDCYKVIRAQV